MHLKKYAEAEKYLLQALEKNASDSDTLVNLIVCCQHQGKPQELITRQINQLRITSPKDLWLSSLQKVQDDFERHAKIFAQ